MIGFIETVTGTLNGLAVATTNFIMMIGPIVMIVTAILTVSAGSRMFAAAPEGTRPLETAFTLDTMEYR